MQSAINDRRVLLVLQTLQKALDEKSTDLTTETLALKSALEKAGALHEELKRSTQVSSLMWWLPIALNSSLAYRNLVYHRNSSLAYELSSNIGTLTLVYPTRASQAPLGLEAIKFSFSIIMNIIGFTYLTECRCKILLCKTHSGFKISKSIAFLLIQSFLIW